MIEKLIMSENKIPDGVLHDQALYKVTLDDNELTLSFKIHPFSDREENEFCKPYKDFKKCHIKCRLEDDTFCSVELKTAINKKDEYRVKLLSFPEFVKISNSEIKKRADKGYWPWSYLATGISPNFKCADIDLFIWLRLKGKVYTQCTLALATSEIEYIWE